jgi:hypothetical protein
VTRQSKINKKVNNSSNNPTLKALEKDMDDD